MRLRVALVFLLGFVLGAACLAIGLWRANALKPMEVTWSWRMPQPPERPLPSTKPLDLNAMMGEAKHLRQAETPVTPAIDYAQPAPAQPASSNPHTPPPAANAERTAPSANAGAADRLAPDIAPIHIAVPIAGIDPHKLNDSFWEGRNGHRHEALDIMAARGTPVMAVSDGNVAKLFNSKQGGLAVYQFDPTDTYCFYYAHLDHYAAGLKEGTLLRKGDVLGYVGTTGDAPANAPHLHLAVFKLAPDKKWWNGTAVDPLPLMR